MAIPNNQIWYTTTDGTTTSPYITSGWGASIKSNTYSGGKGVITFDGNVTAVPSGGFKASSRLKTITLPNTVKTIGSMAFCVTELGIWESNLTTVTLGNGVETIKDAFLDCKKLTSIVIPDSVTTLDGTFENCTNLTNVTLGNSLKVIDRYTFYHCAKLRNVTFPNSLTEIGGSAFNGCTTLTSVVIPDSVIKIGDLAFENCTNVTRVHIGSGLSEINGISAMTPFRGCNLLNTITVDVNNKVYDSRNNCNAIIKTSTNTLLRGSNSTIIPDSVTALGNWAFNGLPRLTSVVIPDSVTHLGEMVFEACTGLTSVVIPDSVDSIPLRAFNECTKLTDVTIGSSVWTIGMDAFSECTSLERIEIPSSVRIIDKAAFQNCSNLIEITAYPLTAPQISEWTFSLVHNNGVLYHPVGSDYSQWLSNSQYYLGYYGWTEKKIGNVPLIIKSDNIYVEETEIEINKENTIHIIVDDNYHLDNVKIWGVNENGERNIFYDGTETTISIFIPDDTVCIEIEAITLERKVIPFIFEGDDFTSNITEGRRGDTVNISLTIDEDYRLASITVYDVVNGVLRENTTSESTDFMVDIPFDADSLKIVVETFHRVLVDYSLCHSKKVNAKNSYWEASTNTITFAHEKYWKITEIAVYSVKNGSKTLIATSDEESITFTVPVGIDSLSVEVSCIENIRYDMIWSGFMKPNIYSQGMSKCNETVSFEASDNICLLQYFDYKALNGYQNIVSFLDIMASLLCKGNHLKRLVVHKAKKRNGEYLKLEDLVISECRFFDEDGESWTMYEVLEEICRYMGYTAIQYRDALILVDYQALSAGFKDFYEYKFYDGKFDLPTDITMDSHFEIEAEDYTMGGAQISLENVYNIVEVKAETDEVEELIPDLFDDDHLVNKYGDWSKVTYVASPSDKRQYINAHNNVKKEEKSDSDYVYVHRILKHKDYESHFYSPESMVNMQAAQEVSVYPQEINVTTIEDECFIYESEHMPGYKEAHTSGRYVFTNSGSSGRTVTVKMVTTVYWLDNMTQQEWSQGFSKYETKVIPANGIEDIFIMNYISPSLCVGLKIADNCWVEKDVKFYVDNNQSKLYSIDGVENEYVNASFVDLASYKKSEAILPLREAEPTISFKRYLAINVMNKPEYTTWYNWTSLSDIPDKTNCYHPNSNYSNYPALLTMNPYSNPFITNNETYLYINSKALYTRYVKANYINPEWTDEATGVGFLSGSSYETMTMLLILKLGIGNKYWDGTAWTTEEKCFHVSYKNEIDKDGSSDLTKIWNKDADSFNNFSWTEWNGGAEGYRIPLAGVDMNQQITFEVRLPSKLQVFDGSKRKDKLAATSLNGYMWVSELKVGVTNTNREYDEGLDFVYSNRGDRQSVNDFSDITCRLTTNINKGALSYSSVGLKSGGFLDAVYEDALGVQALIPEQSIVKKIVNQYKNPTKKETHNLTLDYKPFTVVENNWWEDNQRYCILGQVINFAEGRNEVTMLQTKDATEYMAFKRSDVPHSK